MIRTINLTKVYRTDEIETTALNKINVTIEKGEFISIMGPSGCGKSTLLNVIGLIDSPTHGELYFKDNEVSNYNEHNMTKLRKLYNGFIFQNFNLIDELTVYENVELPLLYQKVSFKERKKRTMDVLDQLKITHREKHFPQQLSNGQQQRVAIARAVVIRPEVILADEPTGNLDSINGLEVMKLLMQLNDQGTTIVMVTHSDEFAQYAHRTIKLLDGSLITDK